MDWLWAQDASSAVGDYSQVGGADFVADPHVVSFCEKIKIAGMRAVDNIKGWDKDPYNEGAGDE